jgi:hypothetical protein
MTRRYFTLEEVEALIPRLTEIMGLTVQLHRLLRIRAEELARAGYTVTDGLLAGLRGAGDPADQPRANAPRRTGADRGARPGAGETTASTETTLFEAQGLYQAIADRTAEIEALGGELKGVDLVDFWSFRDGEEEVMLCWKLGETRIGFFHDAESGFAGRRPVAGHRFTTQRTAKG